MLLKALDTLGVGNADGGGGPVKQKVIFIWVFFLLHANNSIKKLQRDLVNHL